MPIWLWKIYLDVLVGKNGCGTRVGIRESKNKKIEYAIYFLFEATNDMAEYLRGPTSQIRNCKEFGAKRVEVFDSQLVYNHVRENFVVKEEYLKDM